MIEVYPTCTTTGEKYIKCTVCHIPLKCKIIAPLGHAEGEWIIDEHPTCTDEGEKHTECGVCHIILQTEIIEALGHDEISCDAKTPTCTEFGWYAYVVCSRCEYTT